MGGACIWVWFKTEPSLLRGSVRWFLSPEGKGPLEDKPGRSPLKLCLLKGQETALNSKSVQGFSACKNNASLGKALKKKSPPPQFWPKEAGMLQGNHSPFRGSFISLCPTQARRWASLSGMCLGGGGGGSWPGTQSSCRPSLGGRNGARCLTTHVKCLARSLVQSKHFVNLSKFIKCEYIRVDQAPAREIRL